METHIPNVLLLVLPKESPIEKLPNHPNKVFFIIKNITISSMQQLHTSTNLNMLAILPVWKYLKNIFFALRKKKRTAAKDCKCRLKFWVVAHFDPMPLDYKNQSNLWIIHKLQMNTLNVANCALEVIVSGYTGTATCPHISVTHLCTGRST